MVNMKKIGLGIVIPCAFILTGCGRNYSSLTLTTKIIKSSMPAFYNITLDATHEDMKKAGFDYGDIVTVNAQKDGRSKKYNVAYVTNYNEVGSFNKSLCDYEAKGDHLNISPGLDNKGFGDDMFEGGTCTITMLKKQGYTKTRNLAQVTTKLSYEECGSNNERYSNFRDVCKIGHISKYINPQTLYRGSSPFYFSKNPDRFYVADACMYNFGIDSEISVSIGEGKKLDDIMANPLLATNYSKTLYATRGMEIEYKKFFTENLGSDFFDKAEGKGASKIKNIFKYIWARIDSYNKKKSPAPKFYLHCDEGKDRTGFLIMLIEALCGVEYNDLINDFMETFLNYYNISKINNEEKYNTMANLTCFRNLYSFLMEVDDESQRIDKLAGKDLYIFDAKKECDKLVEQNSSNPTYLHDRSKNYLKNCVGMTEEELVDIENYFSTVPPNLN